MEMFKDIVSGNEPELSLAERECLAAQDTRLVSAHRATKLEEDARRHWDLFYKRNESRFFKNRNWTTREFVELLGESVEAKVMLELGCGAGNLIFPLIEQKRNYFIYACDFSPRAVNLVKQNPLYDESRMMAFQSDITTDNISSLITSNHVDIVTMVFVLSAIHPTKFRVVVRNLYGLLKAGGIVLFRDYGLHDMAQIRFKAGHKISENFYMRQDGTRSYYFSVEEVANIFENEGFEVMTNAYVHRRTVNKKEDLDIPRIFVQGKFMKPTSDVANLINDWWVEATYLKNIL